MTSDLHYLELTELARRIHAREISPVEATTAQLARIEKLDGQLKSYAYVMAEAALVQARAAEAEIMRGEIRGPLHGVPIAVKDLCWTRGVPTAAGMTIYRDFRPTEDATVVRKLYAAGAIILGKLQLTEGAWAEHHPQIPAPVNPWNAAHWSGASSSGSGVATAAGLCYASLGSDTGGSIRFPSAANGVTGVKPTWGRVSRYGVFELAATLDHIGPMARSAADCGAMLKLRKRALRKLLGQAPGSWRVERIIDVLQRQFLECGSCFSEQQMSQRLVWQVWQLQRNRRRTKTAHHVQCSQVKLVSEVSGDVSYPQAGGGPGRIPAEGCRYTAGVICVEAVDNRQHQRSIIHRAADRAYLVERPAQRHGPGAGDPAEGGAQTGDAAAGAGRDNRTSVSLPIANPTSPAAVAEAEPALDPRDPSSVFHGITGSPAIPDVAIGERTQADFSEQHGSGCGETADDLRIRFGHATGEGLGTPAGGDAGGVQNVLRAIGNAVQRAQPSACAEQVLRRAQGCVVDRKVCHSTSVDPVCAGPQSGVKCVQGVLRFLPGCRNSPAAASSGYHHVGYRHPDRATSRDPRGG